jgi:hypothetical protein
MALWMFVSNSPSVSYAPRVKIVMYIGVAIALWCAIVNYQLESYTVQSDPYKAAEQADRLAGAMQTLPATGVVGYISDVADSTAALAMFNTSRYALAPRMLVDGVDREFVLGNFTKAPDYEAFAREHHLVLLRDFGGGIAVFRGTPK